VDPDYGRYYRRLYETHWWWRARETAILAELRRLRPSGGWGRMLDIGCGDGLFFDRLLELGLSVEGIEPAADLVSDDPARRGRIYVAPFDASFRPAAPYDLIVMLDVLEHLDRPTEALRHALSILAPGGVLLATVPAFRALWTHHDDINHHVTRYTKSSFRAMAAPAGLRIDRLEYFFHWTFPVKLAQRAVEVVHKPSASRPGLPPAVVNRALYWASRAERAVLGPLRLPFGSSLMIVGGRAT
jgi:SAM-dependent methyltransferase